MRVLAWLMSPRTNRVARVTSVMARETSLYLSSRLCATWVCNSASQHVLQSYRVKSDRWWMWIRLKDEVAVVILGCISIEVKEDHVNEIHR